jgi:hypothetical protein
LNKIVEQDVYPLPLQEEIMAMVAGCMYITVVDAVSLFYQWMIRRSPEPRVRDHQGRNNAITGYCNSVAYVQPVMQLDWIWIYPDIQNIQNNFIASLNPQSAL